MKSLVACFGLICVGGCSGWSPESVPTVLLRGVASVHGPHVVTRGVILRLRGGIGEAMGSMVGCQADLARDVEGSEFYDFGDGPGHTDRSGSKFEAKPTGLYQDTTKMDGATPLSQDSCRLSLPRTPAHARIRSCKQRKTAPAAADSRRFPPFARVCPVGTRHHAPPPRAQP